MTVCLDTNVLIDVLNGRPAEVRSAYQSRLGAGAVVVSSLTAHELIYGALISQRPDAHMEDVRRILAQLEVVDWSEQDALAAARVRARLRREGRSVGTTDAMIAGQALNRRWTLVTANTREFSRVEDLTLEDWSRPTP